ncbi:MAG: MotA/TolQ/ExbB proton channel family protein [Ignavibacteriales bacterium]|nr:MotA/TolQ/ExbB proton channel family protein [Ignavibacteriales bacterium]
MKKKLHYPIYSPKHILHLFTAVVISFVVNYWIIKTEPSSIYEPYLRSKIFFIVEIIIFVFAVLVIFELKIFISVEKYSFKRIEDIFQNSHDKITIDNSNILKDEVSNIGSIAKKTISYYRTVRVIDFFEESKDTADTSSYNDKLSEIIKDNTETNFAYIRYCIWVIPIVGFIGTLWGIMKSVYGFSSILGDVVPGEESKILIQSLRDISVDLSTAFETTLPALIISGILALFLSLLDRSKDRFLLKLDKSLIDNVISKLEQPFSITNSHYLRMIQKVDKIASDFNLTKIQKNEIINSLSFLNSVKMESNDFESISASLKSSKEAWNNLNNNLTEFISINKTIEKSISGYSYNDLEASTILKDIKDLMTQTKSMLNENRNKQLIFLQDMFNKISQNNSQINEIKRILENAAKKGIPVSLEVFPSIKGIEK